MHVFINEREIMAGAVPAAPPSARSSRRAACTSIPSEIVTDVALDGVEFHAGDEERYARRAARGVQQPGDPHPVTPPPSRRQAPMLAETLDAVAQRTRIVVQLLRAPIRAPPTASSPV